MLQWITSDVGLLKSTKKYCFHTRLSQKIHEKFWANHVIKIILIVEAISNRLRHSRIIQATWMRKNSYMYDNYYKFNVRAFVDQQKKVRSKKFERRMNEVQKFRANIDDSDSDSYFTNRILMCVCLCLFFMCHSFMQ